MRLVLFGPARLEIDGRPLPASAWRAQRAFQLLIYLAIHPAGAHRDQLLEAFWPGRQLAAGRKNFHPTLSYIRSVLPDAGVPVLARDAERYRLDPRYPLSCDAWDFDRLLEEERHAPTTGTRRQVLDAAATLAALPYLDGLYGDWADEAQTRMRDRVEQVLIRCGEAGMKDEDYESALTPLRRAVELDGFREQTRVAVIECLVRTGNRRAARVEYERLGSLLRTELDVDPLPETVSQITALLGGALGSRPEDLDDSPASSQLLGRQPVPAIGQVRLKSLGGT